MQRNRQTFGKLRPFEPKFSSECGFTINVNGKQNIFICKVTLSDGNVGLKGLSVA